MRATTSALTLGLGAALALTPAGSAAGQAPRTENPIVITSFDGTPIVTTMFLPAHASPRTPVPVILRTHGWGGSREKSPSGLVARLLANGYAVMTYDSRGFGESGGEANVGSPDYEVRDASTLISYLATRPDVLKDAPGDPRIGWTGGSNAGGIQFNTAAFDHRIDAIVPEISWGDLVQDLIPNDVPKQTWDTALYGAGLAGALPQGLQSPAGPQTGAYAQEIHTGFAQINATGGIDPAIRDWFAHKSTTRRSHLISAPTLIVQGTVDTLFPLQDAFANYRNLVAAGTPVKLITYCAGHTIGGCSYPGGASGYPEGANGRPAIYEDRILAWLDRWVKLLPAPIGAPVEWQAQDGRYYQGASYPLPGTVPVRLPSVGGDTLVGPGLTGGDGPADGNPAPVSELQTTAIRYRIFGPTRATLPMLGVPSVRLTGTLTGALHGHLYLELVDVAPDGTRVTIDDQVTPVRIAAGGFDRTIALNGVSWLVRPGHYLELEVTTGSSQFQHSRGGPYAVKFSASPVLPLTFSPPPPSPPKPPAVPPPPRPKPGKDEHPCNKGKDDDKGKGKDKDKHKDKCKEKDDDELLYPRAM